MITNLPEAILPKPITTLDPPHPDIEPMSGGGSNPNPNPPPSDCDHHPQQFDGDNSLKININVRPGKPVKPDLDPVNPGPTGTMPPGGAPPLRPKRATVEGVRGVFRKEIDGDDTDDEDDDTDDEDDDAVDGDGDGQGGDEEPKKPIKPKLGPMEVY
ncbi:hypothetical protein VTJ04DRAFT_1955 [Mycothermus thermophilus]|uniref:uncharacterized protein n=1 Tax=Humicola insolens TaxID=85995 RepID=UPI0037439AAB